MPFKDKYLEQSIVEHDDTAIIPSSQLEVAENNIEPKKCRFCDSECTIAVRRVIDTRFGIRGNYEIRHCDGCGMEHTWPVHSLSELKTLYEEQYNFGGETGIIYSKLRERFLMSVLYRFWILIDGDISFHSKRGKGRLLDIGCNEGRGLGIYTNNGFQVEGLELNECAATEARKKGFRVYTCQLGEFTPSAPYDVVVLSNVLEHSLNPKEMLSDVHRILRPDGEVWISVPNNRSWFRRLFGPKWINWHVPFHITHFCATGVRELLEQVGYSKIKTRQITPSLWVAQSVIAYCFAKEGKKNLQLRNPLLTFLVTIFCRIILFPVFWLANKAEHGDCLLVVARKT